MCGDSSRISGGGLLAILRRPASTRTQQQQTQAQGGATDECRLFLRNAAGQGSTTTATLERTSTAAAAAAAPAMDGMSLVIHRDGDLMNTAPHPQGPLHYVGLPALRGSGVCGGGGGTTETWPLSRLDLGVGPTGVVGRKIQLVQTVDGESRVLREGVLGWN